MHAFLIVGKDKNAVDGEIRKLLTKLEASPYEFQMAKIDDARYLAKLTSLVVEKPTAYILRDINRATTEALNSFLKNLEEPQSNLYYVLTSPSASLLPTIISRCQIIKTEYSPHAVPDEEIRKFLKMTTGEKLAYCDKIKDRGGAINFVQGIINNIHSNLVSASDNHTNLAMDLKTATVSLSNLEANGNVNLQLTNMSIKLN